MEGKNYVEKFTEIERENRILLEKMHRIMRKHEVPIRSVDKQSLNYERRKKNYQRINQENKDIYDRLVKKQSAYSRKKYASERRTVENRLAMISIFNKPSRPSPKRQSKRISEDILDLKYLVLKKSVVINYRQFIIEIYKYPHDIKILAFDPYSPDIFRLILSHEEAFEIIGESEDWTELLSCLNMEGDTFTLAYSNQHNN